MAETVRIGPLESLGWGLAAVVVLPTAMLILLGLVILLAVVVGLLSLGTLAALVLVLGFLSEGLLASLLWVAVAFVAPLAIGFLVGRLLLERAAPGAADGRVVPLLLGLLVLAVLAAVPYLGSLVGLAVALLGLGALVRQAWSAGRASGPASTAQGGGGPPKRHQVSRATERSG